MNNAVKDHMETKPAGDGLAFRRWVNRLRELLKREGRTRPTPTGKTR